MSVETLFFIIILFYGVIGMTRGCIKTLGGLVSMLVSGALAKIFALPIAKLLLSITNLESVLQNILISAEKGISETGAVFNSGMNDLLPSVGFDYAIPSDRLTGMIFKVLNQTVLNMASILSMFVLFALFMLICGHFVYLFEDLFKKLPLGKTVNRVFGFICGLIKGVFVVLILYFVITCLNMFTSTNIPVNIGRMGEMIQNIVQAVNISKIILSVQDAVHNAVSR